MRLLPVMVGDALDQIIHWAASRLRSQWWLWLLPVAVLYLMLNSTTGRIEHIMGGVVALVVLAWAIRRPGGALIALIVFLPFQTVGFGFLLRLHVPSKVLRPAGGLKELLAAGILFSALHALHVGRTRQGKTRQLDAVDKALLVYVAVVTVYLLVPHLLTQFPVSHHLSVRLLAWRSDCGYLLLFFAVRHAPIPAAARRRFVQVLVGLAVVTIAIGAYQWLRPASWTHLILFSGHQVQYQTKVLGNDPITVAHNLGYLTNRNPLRISSIFLSPFDLADFLLIVFAIGLERITRDYRSKASYLLCGVALAALYTTQVRADGLAAVIIALIALAPRPNRPVTARVRLLGAIVLGAVALLPALSGTRFLGAQGGGASNQGHISELTGGIDQLVRTPLGLGIGNTAGVGDRFVLTAKRQGGFTVDNIVLQVGDELGVEALLPWLVMMVLIWRALGRASRQPDPFTGGIRLAFLAIVIAGMYHHVFLSFPVAWTLWAALGLVLTPAAGRDAPVGEATRGNIDEIDATAASDHS